LATNTLLLSGYLRCSHGDVYGSKCTVKRHDVGPCNMTTAGTLLKICNQVNGW